MVAIQRFFLYVIREGELEYYEKIVDIRGTVDSAI